MSIQPPIVHDYMVGDPFGIDETLTLSDASDRMLAHGVRHLLVVSGEELRGIVSLSDIHLALALSNDDAKDTSVAHAVRPAMTCSPFAFLASVLRDMEVRRLEHVVVVDHDDDVVGTFSLRDAARAARALANRHTGLPIRAVHDEQRVDSPAAPTPVRVKRVGPQIATSSDYANGVLMEGVIA